MRRGADYIASLRDGRVVFLDGEPVDDVTTHPGLRAGRSGRSPRYTTAWRTGRDLVVDDEQTPYNAMWLTPLTPGDLLRRTGVHRYWAEGTFGLMGRTPDHVAALITAFAARPDIFDRGGHRLRRPRERVLPPGPRQRLASRGLAVTPPQIDRSKPAHHQPEPFLYPGIVEERDDGIVVRGAQMIGTSAAIADYLFLSYVRRSSRATRTTRSRSSCRSTPRASGCTPASRTRRTTTTASTARSRRASTNRTTSSSCATYSSRGSTSSSTATSRLVNAQFSETGAQVLANYQALIRFGVKMEFASGLAIELADAHGMSDIPPVQAQLGGDIAAFVAALEAMVIAARPATRSSAASC